MFCFCFVFLFFSFVHTTWAALGRSVPTHTTRTMDGQNDSRNARKVIWNGKKTFVIYSPSRLRCSLHRAEQPFPSNSSHLAFWVFGLLAMTTYSNHKFFFHFPFPKVITMTSYEHFVWIYTHKCISAMLYILSCWWCMTQNAARERTANTCLEYRFGRLFNKLGSVCIQHYLGSHISHTLTAVILL